MVNVEDILSTCYARWEMDVNIHPQNDDSGDRYKGCMAETPWYLLEKSVIYWWVNDRVMEIVIDEA